MDTHSLDAMFKGIALIVVTLVMVAAYRITRRFFRLMFGTFRTLWNSLSR